MECFLAFLRSSHVPKLDFDALLPTELKLENVEDFCNILMSIVSYLTITTYPYRTFDDEERSLSCTLFSSSEISFQVYRDKVVVLFLSHDFFLLFSSSFFLSHERLFFSSLHTYATATYTHICVSQT